jgi:quinol monooxygenase YgiN
MAEPIANAVFLRSTARKEEELAGRLEALVLASRSDPGVMIYDLHRSTADPALWFLYERYESQEHFNRHRENPVLRRFVADAATLLDGNLDVRTFRVIADARGLKVAFRRECPISRLRAKIDFRRLSLDG